MSITVPCIKGQMGSVTYYETILKARELTHSVRPARETDGWASASIDERIQRDINVTRVRRTIVPYLADHPDRFFGSFIVLVQNGQIDFEPLASVLADLPPAAYRKNTENMGFLTISEGDLIALDGQHRLVAFREVITAGGNLGRYATSVGEDEVCVLFVEHESSKKTRRIFNKVNRHAKPTGRSDNIITSEDDGFAIVTRRLLDRDREAPLCTRVVQGNEYEPVHWATNTLTQRNDRLTTLSAVYETVIEVVTHAGFTGFSEKDNPVAPDDDSLEKAYTVAADWWEDILSMPTYQRALKSPEGIPKTRFSNEDSKSLLLRPAAQITLVKGVVRALTVSKEKLSRSVLLDRAERVDWSASASSMWRDVLVRPDGRRMIARKEAYVFGAKLLSYVIASEYTGDDEVHALWIDWNERRGNEPNLPADEVDEEQQPEDLPTPVVD